MFFSYCVRSNILTLFDRLHYRTHMQSKTQTNLLVLWVVPIRIVLKAGLSVHNWIPPSTAYRKCISYYCPLWFTIECHDLPQNESNVTIETLTLTLLYRNSIHKPVVETANSINANQQRYLHFIKYHV
jgi:hypothetical protein